MELSKKWQGVLIRGRVRQYPNFVRLFHTSTPLRSVELSKKWRNSGFHGQGRNSVGYDCYKKNYRPVSNLAFLSKITEKAAALQIFDHVSFNQMFPEFQSAYCKYHSTETVLLRMRNDILASTNKQQVTLLVFLDLSAAFDTVDHDILLWRLEYKFGIKDQPLTWFKSYLSNRSHRIVIGSAKSDSFHLKFGVPQGSCLGPMLFSLYTSEIFWTVLLKAQACFVRFWILNECNLSWKIVKYCILSEVCMIKTAPHITVSPQMWCIKSMKCWFTRSQSCWQDFVK